MILVRACRPRAEYVEYLQRHIPNLQVVWDATGDAMQTFLAALRVAGEQPCTHLEEDIWITQGFAGKLERVIAERPHQVVQFFSMRQADLTVGSRLELGGTFCMNQCFYLPAGYSRLIHNFYAGWPRKVEHPTGYDLLIGDFLKARKEKYFLHVPSLVQHRPVPSLINSRRSRARQSITFTDPLYE